MDAHRDILQDIVADTNLDSLPDDYELVFNNVSDSASEIRVYSRSTGAVYEWEENGASNYLFQRAVSKQLLRFHIKIERAFLDLGCRISFSPS